MALDRETRNNAGFNNQASAEPLSGFGTTAEANFSRSSDTFKAAFDEQNNKLTSIFSQNTAGPLTRQTGTVRLNDLFERTKKIISAVSSNEITLQTLKLDHIQHNLFVPSVLLIGRNKVNPGKVFVYTLMIENENNVEPEINNRGGFKTIIPVVTGTAWDKRYSSAVQSFVAKSFDIQESDVVTFSACVVPKDLDISTPQNDPNAVNPNLENLLANAGYAINTKLKEEAGLEVFVLTGTANNEVMTVEPKFSRKLKMNMAGREMRADIDLTFSLKQNNPKSQSLNGGDSNTRVFGSMTGYIDFIAVQSENQTGSWGNQVQAAHKFSPLFVITSMFVEQAGSIHGQLAMLMSAATMANGDEWVNSLYERHIASKRSGEAIDIGEIGALNIEVNLPQYRPTDAQGINSSFGPIIDTRVADVDRGRYISIVQQLCRQDMYIAIDAPNVGAESWYTDLFRASAMNNEYGRWASNRIWQALQELTNNRFAVHFQSISRNVMLWLSEPINIHNGYYVSRQTSERRDIRDIDQLAINNYLGSSDPLACAKWAMTFMPGVDQERALTERKEMIEQVCGGAHNVVYTGYTTRLFLNPAVIKALLMCAAEVNFNMRFVSAYNGGFGQFGNHAFNFGGGTGLNSGNVGSTFRGGFGHGNQGNVLNTNNFFADGGLRI